MLLPSFFKCQVGYTSSVLQHMMFLQVKTVWKNVLYCGTVGVHWKIVAVCVLTCVSEYNDTGHNQS